MIGNQPLKASYLNILSISLSVCLIFGTDIFLSTMCLINSIQYHYPLSDVNMVNKQHQCSRCEFKAVKKDHLQTHIKSVHEGHKFHCPQCEYKATRGTHLQTHIKSVHEGQKFQCPQCVYKATWKSDLQTHIKSVHEGQKFPCPQCAFKATQKRKNIYLKIKICQWKNT